jgi:hypothetical protein
MQSIARLSGPVVHGFKRGSKLLGWWVESHRPKSFWVSFEPCKLSALMVVLQKWFDHMLSGPQLTWAPPTLSFKLWPQVLKILPIL